jgi:hypothetical protein
MAAAVKALKRAPWERQPGRALPWTHLAVVVVSPTCAVSSWSSNSGLLSSGTKPAAAATVVGCGESMANWHFLRDGPSLLRRGYATTRRPHRRQMHAPLVTAWRGDGAREGSHRDAPSQRGRKAHCRTSSCVCVRTIAIGVCVCVCETLSRGASQRGPIQQNTAERQVSRVSGLHSPFARCAAGCQLGPAPPVWVSLSPAAGLTPRRLGRSAPSPCALSSPSHTVVPPPPPPASASAQRAWRCCCWWPCCRPEAPSAEAHHQKVEMMPSWTRLCWSWATHSDTHIRLRISCSRSLR